MTGLLDRFPRVDLPQIAGDPGWALAHLRASASGDTTLIVVGAPPLPVELTSMIRSGAGFGPKLAVLVYHVDPDTLPRRPDFVVLATDQS